MLNSIKHYVETLICFLGPAYYEVEQKINYI